MGSGGGSSSQTFRKRDPMPTELTNLQNSVYNMLSPIATGQYTDDWKNSTFGSTYLNSMDSIAKANENSNAMQDALTNVTTTGNLPQAVTDNMNAAINSELKKNSGSLLNDLASRGVLNSSVTNRGLGTLTSNAADAYAKNYLDAYNSVSGNLNSGLQTLLSVPDSANSAIEASYSPVYNMWKDWYQTYANSEDYDHVVEQGGGK